MAKIDKLLTKAQEYLDPNEEVQECVLGAYETEILGNDSVRNGIFIATDKRVVFYAKKLTGYELESFPLENISSFESGKGMLGHKISFFASGNKVKMKWIQGENVQDFISYVRDNMGKRQSSSAPSESSNSVDELRQLAELRDAGIITEEEFTQKKKQVLGI
ncbi:hypothetical protein HNQ94_000698 [Salirhabdus euzebyi]|uniref:Short C-terminal domain-containing protein n=1 Tax=Salirhabdus euzebyi TaxID=394506 RepID=A0A841Q1P0_9BACI|nr:PH domain-containing protein [Salirhabdus euzebyi]MBB6452253.1 hypothetical protein [Salirhabdus euzebyi]